MFLNLDRGVTRCVLSGILACCALLYLSVQRSAAADEATGGQISAHLAAGEFGPALQLANSLADSGSRDAWLKNIAVRQVGAGARGASLRTAYGIGSDQLRADAFQQISNQPLAPGGARGGAALADFDTLIELITSTISPESWDTVGGPGAIEEFPTGVYVDPAGIMKRVLSETGGERLSAVRRGAARFSESGDVRRPSPLRKVSLTRLERHAQLLAAAGREADPVMQTLAGMHEVKYVLFYPETRDIVLAGPAGDWTRSADGRLVNADSGRPVLHLDDLVVVLRNAFSDEGRFGCAITPRQENLAAVQAYLDESAATAIKPSQRAAWLDGLRQRLGRQEISVFGIDPRTRAARILVEADYHMKLIGMGLEEGTLGVTSYLDNVAASGKQPRSMDVLRWWFTLNYESVHTTSSRDAYELIGPGVKVLSENEMLSERGERVHTGKSNEHNLEFAHSFTKQFAMLATKYPVYAELKNVFDLALVAAVIRAEDLAGRSQWQRLHFGDSGAYLVDLGPAPREVESVISHRVVDRRQIVVGVSGGVSVDTGNLVRAGSIKQDQYGLLEAARSSSTPDTVPPESWWWD